MKNRFTHRGAKHCTERTDRWQRFLQPFVVMFLISIENNRANKAVVCLCDSWIFVSLSFTQTELSVTVMPSVVLTLCHSDCLWLTVNRAVQWSMNEQVWLLFFFSKVWSWTGEQAHHSPHRLDTSDTTNNLTDLPAILPCSPHPTDDEMRLKINIILAAILLCLRLS